MRKFLSILGTICVASSISTIQPSTAADHLPSCQDSKVIGNIAKRFNKTEKRFWQHRGLVLNTVHNPHLHTDYNLADSEIERRYCHGTATFENNRNRKIHYLIESNAGFAGFGWRVVYCVHGLDPWKYNDGRCRTLSKY